MANTMWSSSDFLKGLAAPTRNRYFYGKLMDAFHFDLEQGYMNRKRWLLNRLVLGHGVVCGLKVAPTADGKGIVVGAGVAIDGLGREIVVPAASALVDPRQPTDACGRASGAPISGAQTVNICLGYHECECAPVPVLTGDCECRPDCAASQVRECYSILVRPGAAPEIKPGCGFPNAFASAGGTQDPLHTMLVERISQPCAMPGDDGCVVLAQISLPPEGGAINATMIDLRFRPIVYTNELLLELLLCAARQGQGTGTGTVSKPSTITNLSWSHDKELPLDGFLSEGLTVTFSDPVKPLAHRGGAWFVVTAEFPVDSQAPAKPPFVLPGTIFVQHVLPQQIKVDGTKALFLPAQDFGNTFDELTPLTLKSAPFCRVTLHCDALTGANDVAVDGNGDGTPGGMFESWFTLTTGSK